MILSFRTVRKSVLFLRIQRVGSQLTLAPFIPLPSQLIHRNPSLFCCILSNENYSYLPHTAGRHQTLTTAFICHLPSADSRPAHCWWSTIVSRAVASVPICLCTKHYMDEFCSFYPYSQSQCWGLVWWGKTDKQTGRMSSLWLQGPCLACCGIPLGCWLPSPEEAASPCCSLTEQGTLDRKQGVILYLSSSRPDKRSNSVLLSWDRNISFFGDSNLTLPYKLSSNGADLYVSSYCELTCLLN